MGVEPFLIASSLIATTAQRLMRKICPNCRTPCEIPKEILARLPAGQEWAKQTQGFKGAGCSQCKNTGYRGRLGAMEILVVDDEVQQLVIEHRSSADINDAARKKGMRSLFENAMIAFREGQTTLEEVLRVTTFDE